MGNEADIPLEVGQYIHVGYLKPFRQFYMEFSALNTEASNITFEYFNGNNWVELSTVIDETEKFIKSGFIHFTRPEDWAATEVDSDELFILECLLV